jgi:hypothetical protein
MPRLENIGHFRPKLTENKEPLRLTLNENEPTLFENSSKTSAPAHISENNEPAKVEFLPPAVQSAIPGFDPAPVGLAGIL